MGEVTNVVAEVTNGEAVLVNDVGQNQMIDNILSLSISVLLLLVEVLYTGFASSCSYRWSRCS